MIGALYQLVENGQVCAGLVNGSAPRTAVGLKRDGSLVMYTIDGRQSGYSIGATLTQVAERMSSSGCVTALSLDGGGSSRASSRRSPTHDGFACEEAPPAARAQR